MSRSMAGDIAYDAFVDGADLPARGDLLNARSLGGSGRELVAALLDRDAARVAALLDLDPALARGVADDWSMLTIAVATADPASIDALVSAGAPIDGPEEDGAPLALAMEANGPDLAWQLLEAGASPTPPTAPLAIFRAGIALGSQAGVRLLLDRGANPNIIGPLGRRPLHVALDMEQFAITELLLDRGADVWAVDHGGANLGTAVTTPMVTVNAAERAAQVRLSARAVAAGWPDPAPTPRDILKAKERRAWPPAVVIPARH